MFKCELSVGGTVYNVTGELVNWEDITVSYKRQGQEGVVRSFSTAFRFCGRAYSLLLSEYLRAGLGAAATVVYYVRNNSRQWQERFRSPLDFSTYGYDGTTCEINAVDGGLPALIKAKRGTQYEYDVAGLREQTRLAYDRLQMLNTVSYIFGGETTDEGHTIAELAPRKEYGSKVWYTHTFVPTAYVSAEIMSGVLLSYDSSDYLTVPSGVQGVEYYFAPFLKYEGREVLSVHLTGKIKARAASVQGLKDMHIMIGNGITFDPDTATGSITGVADLPIPATGEYAETTVDLTLRVTNGYMLFTYLGGNTASPGTITGNEKAVIEIDKSSYLKAEFNTRGPSVDMDLVSPLTLLSRLLRSMNGGQDGIACEIRADGDVRLPMTRLLAAESARGLEGAKLRTSYDKFCQWMSAEFGHVPVVDDAARKVTFVHRDTLYQDKQAKDLGDGTTGFSYAVDSSLVYSRVKVGYEKQDYDSVNGRDEWRFATEYTTGVTLTDNVLELVSPYRADAYGIEFLAQKRGEDTTDGDSDGDVFMVGCVYDSELDRYLPARGGQYAVGGVVSPGTMFNAMYSQRFMLEANGKHVGISASGLSYASCEGNSGATVGGVRQDSDVSLPPGNYTPGEATVTTADLEAPQDWTGYVSFTLNGRRYDGYVKDVSFNHGRPEGVEYTLMVKNVE